MNYLFKLNFFVWTLAKIWCEGKIDKQHSPLKECIKMFKEEDKKQIIIA